MTTADACPGAGQASPSSFTVLVCHGCCCATSTKHPDVDHVGHLHQIEAAVAVAEVVGSRVRVTDCLGPCSRSNVIVIRPREAGLRTFANDGTRERSAIWLGELLDDRAIGSLTAWLRGGGPVRSSLPTALADHRFDPTDEQARRSVRSDQHSVAPGGQISVAITSSAAGPSSPGGPERAGRRARRRRQHR